MTTDVAHHEALRHRVIHGHGCRLGRGLGVPRVPADLLPIELVLVQRHRRGLRSRRLETG
eukprot:3394514-Pyramimonas_sp.AAC.1